MIVSPVRPATFGRWGLFVLLNELEDVPEILFDLRHYMLRQYAPRQLFLQAIC